VNRALRAAAMGALLLSPVALAACSAGQVAQTATQEQNLGNNADLGDLRLRALELGCPPDLAYAQGDDARLFGTVVNVGDGTDTLTGIESDAFDDVEFSGPIPASEDDGPAACTPETQPSADATDTPATTGPATSGSLTPGPTDNTSGTGTTTGGSAGATSAPQTPAPQTTAAPTTPAVAPDLTVPADGSLVLGSADGSGLVVTLVGLNDELTAGEYIDVTFTFQQAGEITVQVPVGVATAAQERGEPFDFHEEENPEQVGGGSA